MSFLLGTDEETIDATVGRTAGFSLLDKDAQPGFTEGAATAAGMGVYRGISRGASVAANVATPVLRPVAQKIDEIFGTSADQYLLDEQAKANRSLIESKIDGQTTGLAGQLLYGIGDVLTTVASTGGNPWAAGGLYGTTQAGIGIIDEGLDTTTAIMKGAVEGVGMGVGVALPAALAGSLAYRLGTGAALNVAQGVATRAGVATVLNTRGYEDMAKQYEAFGVTDMLIDGVLGATFGGFMGKVKPSDVDAALVRQSQAHTELGTAPGIPVDTVSRNAHVKAVDMAREQMLRGEDVEVSRVADRATFAREDMPPEMAAAVREVESVPELARAVRELEETQEMARARGLVVDDAPLYSRDTGGALSDVLRKWDDAGITHDVSEKKGVITLGKIVVPDSGRKSGKGTEAMRSLVDYADRTGQRIELGASSQLGGDKARLVDFYERFGFKRKPRSAPVNKPFKDTAMYRDPSSPKYSRAQEETPEFKQWFGDSKVVDADGKPLVVYHGTTADFTRFDLSKTRFNRIDLAGSSNVSDVYSASTGGNTMPLYVRIENPATKDQYSIARKEVGTRNASEYLSNQGFDGVIDGDFYQVFNANQIKSASENNGAYNVSNPDIRFSGGDSSAKSTVPELTTRFRSEFGKDADRLTNYARVEFVQSVSDLPGGPHPSDVRGMFWQGRSYVVADNVPPDAIKGLILHEVGTHAGFHTMLGAEGYASVMNHIDARIADGDAVFMKAREIAEQRANRPEHIREETLAYLVDAAPELPFIRRILAQVRQWLYRQTGGRFVNLNADDMAAMVSASLRVYAKQAEAEANGGMPMYQRPAGFPQSKLVESDKFKTGQPVTFGFIHNTESATKLFGKPKKGDRFQRDIEPSGRYVNEGKPWSDMPEKMISGEITFNNPLVLNESTWKTDLNEHYRKRGKELSKAIISDGYDGVVTVGKYGTSEILDLTTFDEAKAKYSRADDIAAVKEAANQPLGTAIDDNPDMRIPDESGVVRSAVDIAADAADEIQRMNELSNGFSAAVECAFRFGT